MNTKEFQPHKAILSCEFPVDLLAQRPNKEDIVNLITLGEFYNDLEKYCDLLERRFVQLPKEENNE